MQEDCIVDTGIRWEDDLTRRWQGGRVDRMRDGVRRKAVCDSVCCHGSHTRRDRRRAGLDERLLHYGGHWSRSPIYKDEEIVRTEVPSTRADILNQSVRSRSAKADKIKRKPDEKKVKERQKRKA